MEIEELKKRMQEICKKHNLPSFDELNSEFDIGKIERDSGNLMRDVRRAMMEKIVHYIRLGELMVNPSQAPPVFLVLLREINSEDKKAIDEMFKSFVSLEIRSYKSDLDFSDKGEAELIKEIYDSWNKSKAHLRGLIKTMERNWGNNQVKREKGYFS